ncbi:MAG: tetratricopeptide repeat protein [Bacteroidetes bacterium]|nr:tetratricopeptide repeat protein [Bacteroidota bacterium]
MRKVSFYILLAIVLFATACQNPDNKTKKPDNGSDYPEYTSELTKHILANPDDANALFERAVNLFDHGDDSLAYLDIKKTIELAPDNSVYYLAYGEIAYRNNEIADAQTAIKHAIELDPKFKEAYLRLARIQFDLKDFNACNKTLETLSLKVGELPDSYFIFGLIKKELGDTSSAIANFRKTVALDNDYFDAYMQLGLLFGAQKNKLGIDYLNNAVRIHENSTEALYARGKLYQDLGAYKNATEDYDRIVTLNPDYAAAYYNVGWINFRVEHFERAIEYFNKAVIADEEYADAYYMRGLSYQALGNNSEARRNYQACLKLNPEHKLAGEMMQLISSNP